MRRCTGIHRTTETTSRRSQGCDPIASMPPPLRDGASSAREEWVTTAARRSQARDLAAVSFVAAACPAALFGGELLGCLLDASSPSCALDGLFLSPFLLVGAGLVAGTLLHGWRGLALLALGVILGMVALLVVSLVVGSLVPIDPVQGVIATIWFLAPTSTGYALGRAVARLAGAIRSARRRPEDGRSVDLGQRDQG